KGIPISMSKAISGCHNDLFEIENNIKNMLEDLHKSKIETKGLFLNADAGFDSENFRLFCFKNEIQANVAFNKRNNKMSDNEYFFDEELYKNRYKIERTNSWLDAFKAIIIRYEKLEKNWTSLHYIAFIIILFNKVYF
ncbi:transposase, partial [Aureivirga sp. CE67]|uniref:transposase n=1 Tax=Aureivirga sp. CE67 TaxID=1788983 RepID=UPI0018CB4D64